MEDVDFYVGGALELPVSAGVTGPLFTCIVARQFHNYKFGDRFWFERQGITGFTEGKFHKDINALTAWQVDGHFANGILKFIFLRDCCYILIQMSQKCVPSGPN